MADEDIKERDIIEEFFPNVSFWSIFSILSSFQRGKVTCEKMSSTSGQTTLC